MEQKLDLEMHELGDTAQLPKLVAYLLIFDSSWLFVAQFASYLMTNNFSGIKLGVLTVRHSVTI